MAAQAPQAG
jgi:hypothetical protein